MLPTPAISYLVKELGASMGVVVSASHNPSQYNGIKFFDNNGIKLKESLEKRIEKEYKLLEAIPKSQNKGKIKNINGAEQYLKRLKETINISLAGLNVSLDCANGAVSFVGPQLLEEMGVKTRLIGCKPDGLNINAKCGSTNPKALQERMKKYDLNAGLALDGDADRVVAVDAKGNIVDGDYIMAICAKQMLEESSLGGNMVVTTVMTNMGFHLAMKDLGIDVLSTQVGDKYVLEEMLKTEANLGGEQSGHIIFLEYSPAGDGLQTSLKLLEVMQKTGKSLEELAKVMKRLPQVLLNIKVSNKNGLNKNEKVISVIKEAKSDLGERGRILVRPSGTEDLVRVMTESDSQNHAQEVAGRVAKVVEKEFC